MLQIDPTAQRPTVGFEWKNRRRWIWASSIFCMLVIGYCLYKGEDTRIYETAITASFMLLGSVGGSYVFGAAWEHKQIAAHQKQPGEVV